MRPVNDEEVLADLRRQTIAWGSNTRLAEKVRLDPRHLHQMKSGARPVNERLAAELGWELRWVRADKKITGVTLVDSFTEGD